MTFCKKLFNLLVLIAVINIAMMISVHRGKTHCKKWCPEVRARREAMWHAHNVQFHSEVETADAKHGVFLAEQHKYNAALGEARDCPCRPK